MAKRKVFLVDDDPMQTQMLKDHLNQKLNVDVLTFTTGEDCLANIDQNPEAIVLDYHLSSVDKSAQNGIDILQKIKKVNSDIEVIMLSGQDKIEVAVETMRHGAFDYIIKNESAFLRAENILLNIFKGLRLQENLKNYKKAVMFLSLGIIVIIALAAVLYITGIGGDSQVGLILEPK